MKQLLTLLILLPGLALSALPGLVVPPITLSEGSVTIIDPGSVDSLLRTNNDSIFWQTNYSAATYLKNYTLSETPMSATVTGPGEVAGNQISIISTGSVLVDVRFGLLNKPRFNHLFRFAGNALEGNVTNTTFVSHTAASLANHIRTNVDARLTGLASSRRQMFSTRDLAATNFVRNTDFFLADIAGIESYIAGNNSVAGNMNGVLISPQHILSVFHIGSQMGQNVYFVNRTNNSVTVRTVVATARAIYGLGDMTVGLLNAPVPDSIVPAAMVTNIYSRLPGYIPTPGGILGAEKVPVLMFNQDVRPAVHLLDYIMNTGFSTRLHPESDWTQNCRGGDSGSPCLVPINGRMVVVGNWTSVNSGTCAMQVAAAIQWTMNLLSSNNDQDARVLEILDMGGFTDFTP
jgi:hypothetical protein